MNSHTGGGIACLSYYNALESAFPGLIDVAMAKESCYGRFHNAIPIPPRGWSDYFTDFSIHRNKSFLKEYLKQNAYKYSLCIINVSVYAGDMMDLIHNYGIKIVVIHHNYEVEYYMTNKSKLTLGGLFSGFIKSNEKKAYKNADLNLFLTMPDMEKLRNVYGETHASCKLLGVFEGQQKDIQVTSIFPSNTIAITGGLAAYQTYQSIKIFGDEYYKILKQHYPDVSLIIAGRNPHKTVIDFQSRYTESVKVIPNPVDMDAVIKNATVYLCPTYIGGGLKLRLMDGLRNGLPVLTHRISARGYEAFHSKPYFQVYEDIPSFISGIKAIFDYLHNTDNTRYIISSDYYKEFSFESGVQRMRDAISPFFK